MATIPGQDHAAQRRNLLLFAACVAMQYLAAPVIYVGITQSSLLDKLGANATIANLPAASFFVMATLVALVAWYKPRVIDLKPVLVWCYLLAGLTSALLGLVLISPLENDLKIYCVILQSGITGATIPTAIAFIWEVLGRGTRESERGLALGLAYGLGPVLAALGSLGSQLILAGKLEIFAFSLEIPVLDFPGNFALLFLIEAPVMVVAAVLASRFVIEIPEQEEPGRKPFAEVQDLFVGVLASIGAMVCVLLEYSLVAYALMGISTLLFAYHFRDLLSSRLLRLAIIVTVLVYIGNIIPSNMALFSKDVLGVDPDQTAGYQNAMRFGFKAIAGLMLGWILTRSNARSGVLVTSGLYVMALVWAIFASSGMYLFAFGIFGAGELVGVYAPNYILSASRKSQMRRSMVLMNLLMAPVGQLGPVFGKIADSIREKGITAFGESSEALGFKVSFAVCALVIVLGILVAVVWLPGNPSPADDSEVDVS
jgi:MFS family permease